LFDSTYIVISALSVQIGDARLIRNYLILVMLEKTL
jgi:hypothetical protein